MRNLRLGVNGRSRRSVFSTKAARVHSSGRPQGAKTVGLCSTHEGLLTVSRFKKLDFYKSAFKIVGVYHVMLNRKLTIVRLAALHFCLD